MLVELLLPWTQVKHELWNIKSGLHTKASQFKHNNGVFYHDYVLFQFGGMMVLLNCAKSIPKQVLGKADWAH
jgi:hypothetical protein